MPTITSKVRQNQWGCMGAITTAQSPKFVTPEKKKYPVPVKRLKAQAKQKSRRVVVLAFFAARNPIQKIKLAARLTNVPPAATSRESKELDHAAVLRTPA